MNLIPMPVKIAYGTQNYAVAPLAEIVLSPECGFEEFKAAKLLRTEMERSSNCRVSIGKSADTKKAAVFLRKTGSSGEEYGLSISESGAVVTGGTRGIFWGIQTLRQIVRQCTGNWPFLEIEDCPAFEERGFYHDVTRGKVPKLSTLKELADRLSFYKINQLQLYIEHSFAFEGMSEAWMGKDPLTAEDILELDEYCRARHIELVPSMATFGHLYEILITKTWRRCSELPVNDPVHFSWHDRMAHHTLDVTNEDSFRLVQSMLDQYIPLFSSSKFNICCDETFDIGKGKTAELVEKIGSGRVYVDFLKKIMNYVRSKGKKVMFWGDIILKSPEYLKELPKDAECLYWNYWLDINEEDVKAIASSGMDFAVCPGVSGWNNMINRMDFAFENISKVIRVGKKFGAKGTLNTDWGDFGHVNLFANSMPGMSAGAALSWNPGDSRDFSGLSKAYSSLEYGSRLSGLVEKLNELSRLQTGTWAYLVCWREYKLVNNPFIPDRIKEIEQMNEKDALNGYRLALSIENELAALPAVPGRETDLREFVCAARAVALFNAASLAIKKYEFGSPDAPLALGCGELAVELEYWYTQFAALWRERNHESELYRIRTTLQDLCSFLRDHDVRK